jgi:hypothetical protein
MSAHTNGWKHDIRWRQSKDANGKPVIFMETKSPLPDSNEMKEHFLEVADTREVYHLAADGKRVESVQIFAQKDGAETLVFESTQINYNQPNNPKVFQVDLPQDVVWYKEPEKVNGPDPYAEMTAEQAARAFFEACGREDWDEAAKFYGVPLNGNMKNYMGGVKIVSLGTAYKTDGYGGVHVPYEIELRPQDLNARVSKTNAAGRYVITGFCDSSGRV